MEKTFVNKCEDLVSIIKDFRKNELEIQINTNHVQKWVSQFSEKVREIILDETIFVFKKWYFNKEYIKNTFIHEIIEYLCDYYHFLEKELFNNISFLNIQSSGLSQNLIVEMINEKYSHKGINIICDIKSNLLHYIYIDDGLYTGSRIRKDLEKIIEKLPSDSTLDVFYLVAYENSYEYTKDYISKLLEDRTIKVNIHSYFLLPNLRKEITSYDNGTEIVTTNENNLCLWIDESFQDEPEIKSYFEYLKQLGSNYEKIPFRYSHWSNDSGAFSSAERRNIVEKEFFLKGIELLDKNYDNKGEYPLGYNLWPSFGFGSFVATDLNISNTCPLVLWSSAKGWYPLLPRRINEIEMLDFSECYNFEDDDYYYNTCPTCGEKIGFFNDVNNGFCSICGKDK